MVKSGDECLKNVSDSFCLFLMELPRDGRRQVNHQGLQPKSLSLPTGILLSMLFTKFLRAGRRAAVRVVHVMPSCLGGAFV